MARTETDKEDLIKDATALVERAEYAAVTHGHVPQAIVTIGYRRDGSLSVYFDQDPFYQFDARGLLRRAYKDGFLYRSQGDTLARFQRRRTDSATTLERVDLTSEQLKKFQTEMLSRVAAFRNELLGGCLRQLRYVSVRGDMHERTLSALAAIAELQDNFLAHQVGRRK